jgi:hypothetical protein
MQTKERRRKMNDGLRNMSATLLGGRGSGKMEQNEVREKTHDALDSLELHGALEAHG